MVTILSKGITQAYDPYLLLKSQGQILLIRKTDTPIPKCLRRKRLESTMFLLANFG